MANLDVAFAQFGAQYPRPKLHPNGVPTGHADDWEGLCAAFCNRFIVYVNGSAPTHGDITTAWSVALNSGPLDLNPATAGPGSQHFWSQRYVSSGKPGHVATELSGHRLGMASAYCDSYIPGSVHLGYSTVATYNARRGNVLEYKGHTRNYAGAVINATGTAGGDENPLENDLDATQAAQLSTVAYEIDQLFKAVLGIDASGAPVALDKNYNLGQSLRQSIWEGRQGIQQLIDHPTSSESIDFTPILTAIKAVPADMLASLGLTRI